MRYVKSAAQQGDPVAQHNTEVRYRDGLTCDQSNERSAEWFQKTALQGHANAQNELGFACQYSEPGVPQSDEKAIELYSQCAAQGNPQGQSNLGLCYYDGRGCKQNYERAVELFRQSAAQGNTCNLAVCAIRAI